MKRGFLIIMLVAAMGVQAARPARWALSTNLLWDATATANLGAELRTGFRTSVQLPVSYNGWSAGGERRWRHILVQPEMRWWRREAMQGSFWGVHAHYAFFNVGGLPLGSQLRENRFEGSAVGAGISWGHRWQLAPSVGLEATVGAGYAYLSYDKYACGSCGESRGHATKHWVGPTRVGLSLTFGMARRTEPKAERIYVMPQPEPVVVQKTVLVQEPVAVEEPVVAREPQFIVSFVMPPTEAVKVRSASGSACLDFAVGSSKIDPSLRNNAQELRKIGDLIAELADDPDATLTDMTIVGHASPEGLWAANKELSERRAQALRGRLSPVLPIRAWGAGEDWEGLDSLVRASSMVEKERILEIIRGTGLFDGREARLMQLAGGAPYRRMKAEMFPLLRRTDYRVDYTVAAFTIDRGREVFATRPGNLSLNELYLVARSYDRGSERFSEVFDTAARLYPDSDIANLNAAASALQRRDIDSALKFLGRVRVQSPAYWNNMGILAWLQGYRELAAECFGKGGAEGGMNLLMVNAY